MRECPTADAVHILVPDLPEAHLLEHPNTGVVADLDDGVKRHINRVRHVPADESFGDLGGEP